MTAIHKIDDDFYDDSFLLIAMHSTMADYAMAYELNITLKANFKRTRKDFDLFENSVFPCFEWQDTYHDRCWVLVANQSLKRELLANNDLFQNESTYSVPRLVPELKDVDYFLKIEEDITGSSDKIIKNVLTMPKVMAAYEVDSNKLKSKNNLIF
ncbi:IPExxxVDY family protein [Maribacter sp. MJ134]|uniref:IPExxxVDY family protein n=1 Tax=Maribacter sp. MJ134 TaxID=2496865 RepID=UPI000F84CBED|nr:IPExxxVDY family protein [Maribacter sp. MJ134]AZQ59926.1 IPExxxVDY family protein [Maribacter sp. MJ134]